MKPRRKFFFSKALPDDREPAISLLDSAVPPQQVNVYFSQQIFVLTLLIVALSLTVIHLVAIVDRFMLGDIRIITRQWYPLIDLNREANFPSYFASVLLLFAAVLLAIVSLVQQQVGDRFVRHWRALSLIFVALSIDEALSLHEKTMPTLKQILGADGIFFYPWVIPAIGLVLVLLLVYLKFLLALPLAARRGILLAGAIYLSGAIGTEMVTGLWVSGNGRANFTFGLLAAIEESLEMLGLILLIGVLLSFLRSIAGTVAFQLVKAESQLNPNEREWQ